MEIVSCFYQNLNLNSNLSKEVSKKPHTRSLMKNLTVKVATFHGLTRRQTKRYEETSGRFSHFRRRLQSIE